MEPLFSVIIPHFNLPDLLMRCLNSIPVSQDIQVIVVDDNSPDAGTYLEKYPELSRPYLEFICTTGGGAGHARNVGLKHARGKWLLFADADDFFADGMKDIIYAHAESEADVIYFRKKNVYSSNIDLELVDQAYLDDITDTFLQQGDEWPIRTTFYVPYAKMVKRELVEKWNIRYDEIKYGNDYFFAVCTGCYAQTIEAFNEVLYVKTQRDGSLSDRFCQKPNELKIRSEVALRADKFLMERNMTRIKKIKRYLYTMINLDRPLFIHYYFNCLEEVYPSRWAAVKDMCQDTPLRFKVQFIPYILIIECAHLLGLIKKQSTES